MASPTFTWSQSSPNPEWSIGTPLVDVKSDTVAEWRQAMKKYPFKQWDPEHTEPLAMYKILIGGIVPRPIAFVSTISSTGVPNLAPFSFFQMLSHHPPVVMISTAKPTPNRGKDTAENIFATKEFTVNIISDAFIEGANWTGIDAPPEVDEWVGSGLTKLESTIVKPPRVAESAFSMECEYYSRTDFPSPKDPNVITTTMIIGLIKRLHVREDILNANGTMVDAGKLRPAMRLGAISYGRLTEGYLIPPPKWADTKEEYERVARS